MLRIVVICSILALAGCAGSTSKPQQTPASSESYDLSKLSELEDDMPPGFIPYPSEVEKLPAAYVPGVGAVVSQGKPFTADSGQCQVLLKPVDGQVGAETIGIRADGQKGRMITVGADMPVAVPAEIPSTGCDRIAYTVPGDRHTSTGTAERIAAPTIDGATTFALTIMMDGFADPEYFYAAILDDRIFVDVHARLAPDFAAQPLLPDLLVKAVAAIRER